MSDQDTSIRAALQLPEEMPEVIRIRPGCFQVRFTNDDRGDFRVATLSESRCRSFLDLYVDGCPQQRAERVNRIINEARALR